MKKILSLCLALLGACNLQAQVLKSYVGSTTAGSPHWYLYNNTSAADNSLRWTFNLNGGETTGSENGADLQLVRYNASGTAAGTVFLVKRSTGVVTFNNAVLMPNNTQIYGTSTGQANQSSICFYESNGTKRQGFIGKGSPSNNDLYWYSEIGGMNIRTQNGEVKLTSDTKVFLSFQNIGLAAPSFNTLSNGAKIVLYNDTLSSTSAGFNIGMESKYASWMGVPNYDSTYAINYYGGTTKIATLDGTGNFKVSGKISTKELTVKTNVWADFVFDPSYHLPALSDIKSYINTHKHLPDMPSATEVISNGQDLGDIQRKLLQKVEELTLHMIRLEEENKSLKAEIENLKK